MTTCEPGASVVLTHGALVSPNSMAFLANNPAPIITSGFDVFVHEVIAAITTAPCLRVIFSPSSETSISLFTSEV